MLDTEARIAVLVKQMAAAIRYIHSMGIVHRDIKFPDPNSTVTTKHGPLLCAKHDLLQTLNGLIFYSMTYGGLRPVNVLKDCTGIVSVRMLKE